MVTGLTVTVAPLVFVTTPEKLTVNGAAAPATVQALVIVMLQSPPSTRFTRSIIMVSATNSLPVPIVNSVDVQFPEGRVNERVVDHVGVAELDHLGKGQTCELCRRRPIERRLEADAVDSHVRLGGDHELGADDGLRRAGSFDGPIVLDYKAAQIIDAGDENEGAAVEDPDVAVAPRRQVHRAANGHGDVGGRLDASGHLVDVEAVAN